LQLFYSCFPVMPEPLIARLILAATCQLHAQFRHQAMTRNLLCAALAAQAQVVVQMLVDTVVDAATGRSIRFRGRLPDGLSQLLPEQADMRRDHAAFMGITELTLISHYPVAAFLAQAAGSGQQHALARVGIRTQSAVIPLGSMTIPV
jgi:hypothetical protein